MINTPHTAAYPDLMRFASESGLDVTYGKTKLDEVRSKVVAAFGDAIDIPVGKASEPEQVAAMTDTDALKTSAYRDDPKVTVNIASDPQNGGNHPYPICVNGDQILVKRDIDVAIPYRHFIALRNARETVMRQEFDSANQRYTTIESEQYACRFSVVDMPTQSEIEQFHERTKDLGREPVKQAA